MSTLTFRPSHSGALNIYDGDIRIMHAYRIAGRWEACLSDTESSMVGRGDDVMEAIRDCLNANLLDLALRAGVVGDLVKKAEKGIEFKAGEDCA